tara:strand:+ start:467 stop:745 length:279 start_codon:yes stop_codon:yes gene_type:complete
MLEDNQKEKINSWKERELGAFWTQDSKKGKYLSGSVDLAKLAGDGKMRVVMFPNSNKENDNQPDYILYVSKDAQPQASNNETKKAEIPETLV